MSKLNFTFSGIKTDKMPPNNSIIKGSVTSVEPTYLVATSPNRNEISTESKVQKAVDSGSIDDTDIRKESGFRLVVICGAKGNHNIIDKMDFNITLEQLSQEIKLHLDSGLPLEIDALKFVAIMQENNVKDFQSLVGTKLQYARTDRTPSSPFGNIVTVSLFREIAKNNDEPVVSNTTSRFMARS